jgi:hypothetical protein
MLLYLQISDVACNVIIAMLFKATLHYSSEFFIQKLNGYIIKKLFITTIRDEKTSKSVNASLLFYGD